jgi:hypothetical protein
VLLELLLLAVSTLERVESGSAVHIGAAEEKKEQQFNNISSLGPREPLWLGKRPSSGFPLSFASTGYMDGSSVHRRHGSASACLVLPCVA